jgi:hypothetical protein
MSRDGHIAFLTQNALFVKYGKTTTQITDALPSIAIGPFAVNNDGVVAFAAQLDPNASLSLFIGDGVTTTKIADDVIQAAINNVGHVVFHARSNQSEAIFVGPSPITRVVGVGDTVLGTIVTTIGFVDLNDSGQISFAVNSSLGPGVIYRATPRRGGYRFEKIGDGFTPSINNAGQVSFLADITSPTVQGIFVGDGNTVRAIAVPGDGLATFRFVTFGSTPVINDHDAVSFFAESDSGEQGIFVGHDGTFTQIADSVTGPCAAYGTFTSIDRKHKVGFHCSPRSLSAPETKDDCKAGGWKTFTFPRTFKNQGDCIQFVNTGGR